MTPTQWLLLHNLTTGQHWSSGMHVQEASEALAWAERCRYLRDWELTDAGIDFWRLNKHDKPKE